MIDNRSADSLTVTGADLYRISCQPCHQASGRGCGDEIRSLIDPVRATSAAFTEKRMEERGHPIPLSLAKGLASQAEVSLRGRLKHGGEKMPSFGFFSQGEQEALLSYLRRLTDVPEATSKKEVRVREPITRVGELIVRGTCHICHDATRSNLGRFSSAGSGAEIPSLALLRETRSLQEIINKVQRGAPRPGERRGRMPVFDYLSEKEITAAYIYLITYPPTP